MRFRSNVLTAALVAVLAIALAAVAGVPPLINYQGKLQDADGDPVTTPVTVIFAIWDDPSAGDSLWSEPQDITPNADGLFSVLLGSVSPIPDSAFAGAETYLSIKIGADPELSPRQRLASVPYTYSASSADLSLYSDSTGAITDGAVDFADIGQNGAASGQIMKWNGTAWIASDQSAVPDNDWTLTDDVLYTNGEWGIARAGNTLYGTEDSTHVNLGVACTTGVAGQDYAYATVSGGLKNTANTTYSTVGGGVYNAASGYAGTVGGGSNNTVSGADATVGGGYSNTAGGDQATVGGGSAGTASGYNAMVPGGKLNVAQGDYSFAAGRQAKALHHGTFVWADGYPVDFSSTAAHQFLIRAGGGMGINLTDPTTDLDVNGQIRIRGGSPAAGKVLTSGADGTATWETSSAVPDNDWALSDDVLFTAGEWGIARAGNTLYGTEDSTHVNLGVACTTGVAGQNYTYATVSGGEHNTASSIRSTVGGGGQNAASDSATTVGGGYSNTASGKQATVGGGYSNTAGGLQTTVGGGSNNSASGPRSTVGGGLGNIASDSASTVGGGYSNTAGGLQTTVGGGSNNTASGFGATVPGGMLNVAQGNYSFATGRRAKALNNGSFVWGDATDADFSSTAANQFLIRAGGGMGINLTDPTTDLDVNGQIRIRGGSPAAGKVLTSGADGTATWETPSGVPDNDWSLTSDVLYTNGQWGIARAGNTLYGTHDSTHVNLGVACTTGVAGQNYKYATVGGGSLNTASGSYVTVGGGAYNTGSGTGAAVGGGLSNTVSGTGATVGGGSSNTVSVDYGTVGGGTSNTASGSGATVAGGGFNSASLDGATVGGGLSNTASGNDATVVGGYENTASGTYATVGGGMRNVAQGSYSFAAGRNAKALHDGSFVWGDVNNADISSTASNQFRARASGGVWFYTHPALATGVTVAAGGGAWSSVSDRDVKRNIRPVDGVDILEKLARLEISRWSFKTQDESIEHIGPMAQDFYRLFAVGEDDKHISTIDPDGIALAAIQALLEKIEGLEGRIAELEAEKRK